MAEETKKVEAETTTVVEEPKKDISDKKVKAPAPDEKCSDDTKAIVPSESIPHLKF